MQNQFVYEIINVYEITPVRVLFKYQKKKTYFFGRGGGDLLKNLFHLPKTLVASTQMVMPC